MDFCRVTPVSTNIIRTSKNLNDLCYLLTQKIAGQEYDFIGIYYCYSEKKYIICYYSTVYYCTGIFSNIEVV